MVRLPPARRDLPRTIEPRQAQTGWSKRMFGMDSFEFNKIAGAVLGTLLFVMGMGILAAAIFAEKRPVVAGYALPSAEPEKGGSATEPAAQSEPLPVLLAKADPKKGEGLIKPCTACHSFEKGG